MQDSDIIVISDSEEELLARPVQQSTLRGFFVPRFPQHDHSAAAGPIPRGTQSARKSVTSFVNATDENAVASTSQRVTDRPVEATAAHSEPSLSGETPMSSDDSQCGVGQVRSRGRGAHTVSPQKHRRADLDDDASFAASQEFLNHDSALPPDPPERRPRRARAQPPSYAELPPLPTSPPPPPQTAIPILYGDTLCKALYVEGRLPFLPRNLRRATEYQLRMLRARGLFDADPRVGVPVEEAEETGLDKWVCSICPERLLGWFGSEQGRDVHLHISHPEYSRTFIANQIKRAGRRNAPNTAQMYRPEPLPPVARSTTFPHIRDRTTGLAKMTNLGYMTEHALLDELRALQHPGSENILQAAWRRHIWLHRQDFIRDPPQAVEQFVQDYSAPVRVAGDAALYAFLLWLVSRKYIGGQDLFKIYSRWLAEKPINGLGAEKTFVVTQGE